MLQTGPQIESCGSISRGFFKCAKDRICGGVPEGMNADAKTPARCIDQPAHAIAKQQQDGLVASKTDPRTLAIALVSMFNGMRVMILLGVERDELRCRWIEIVRALFRGPEGEMAAMECPPDCAGFAMCNRTERAE